MKKLTDGEKDILFEEQLDAQDYREEGEEELDEELPPDYWDEWDAREAWKAETGRNTYPTSRDEIIDFEPTPF